MEEILKQARELYPVGTKYICAASNPKTSHTRKVQDPESFTINENKIYGDPGEGCIYYKGEWAVIVEPAPPSYLVKVDDRIVFRVRDESFEYRVFPTHLSNVEERNDAIFKALGMGDEEKMRFCDRVYGYDAEGGSFPECKAKDYEALTNIVKALYDECNKINVYYEV
jgi:hypothetical protein